ncbi:FAST kinase domain-containing protein 5, mitochondrial [Pungitius pungitius]|uniref:FAST kinase domain-containing protein 5, mitochondrial n=1 Tax=Pungitius pungitius TaxID=134920 RepID=UPI002E15B58A
MAASVLCRRVPGLRYLPVSRKDFTQAQLVPVKPQDETDDREGEKDLFQHQEASPQGGYRLHYNPSSYHPFARNSATSPGQTDDGEGEQRLYARAPSFWQRSNLHRSVSCSRHICGSKSTLLHLALNKGSEPERPPVAPSHRKATPPDVKVDPRAFLKCRPVYASTTLDLSRRPQPIDWEETVSVLQKVSKGGMKPPDVSRFLAELGRSHPDKMALVRSDQRFVVLLQDSVEHLCLFTPLQLLDVLQSFVWLDIPSAHAVLGQYEAELSRRAGQMTLHQLLLAADLWRCIGRQVPEFLQHLYEAVRLNLGQMGVPELVQLLYITGESRQCPRTLIPAVERLLLRHVQQLYPEEVGAVCLGLFKSQTSISEGAVTRIVDKAQSFVGEMSDFAMVNVLKFLRFSYLYHPAWLDAVAREFPGRAHVMGVKGLMHVALACSAIHYHNDNILVAIAERVPSLVPHCRSKDACKLLWSFGTLGFLPARSPSFYPSLTEALRRKKAEFQRYPEHLLTGLLGLAFVSQFPQDLIAFALSPHFVSLALKSTQMELKKDLFTLDGVVALELPQWSGPRLSRELREEVKEMLWKFAQSDLCQKPEVREAESALQDLLGGEQFVVKRMILPHTRSIDLEVHFDSTGQPIPVNPASHTATLSQDNSASKNPSHQGWERMNVGVTITEQLLAQLTNTTKPREPFSPAATAKPPPVAGLRSVEGGRLFDTGLDLTADIIKSLAKPCRRGSAPQDSKGTVKLAIQVSSRNHYCCGSQQMLGLPAMKRRQLKLAGYRVVELGHQEWLPLLRKSRAEKLAHLHCKIYNSL